MVTFSEIIMNSQSGDSIRVVHPLFQVEGGGSTPTSPLQLNIGKIDRNIFEILNREWHSRLPNATNTFEGIFFGAEFDGKFYAVAWWSKPVARALAGRGMFELRRFAIANNAPKNTASRMLAIMKNFIFKEMPNIRVLISYQDTDVHNGTIYKGAGWKIGNHGQRIDEKKNYNNWKTRPGRKNHSTAPKVRWEMVIRPEPVPYVENQKVEDSILFTKSEMDLFADTVSTKG